MSLNDCQEALKWLLIIFFTLLILDCTCDIGFMKFLGFSEGFELQQPMVGQQPSTMGPNPAPPTPIKMAPSQGAPQKIVASEALGENEDFASVSFKGRTPATCYPQDTLKPEDLLPTADSKAVQDFNNSKPDGEGILKGVNFLDAGFHVGVNTVGQSLRNANLQLRSEPPNPQVAVSPWSNTTIAPDLQRKPLELNESCPGA
tara:strand:- start:1545 stop:2150 length:606 start_codon:yes stop_codon:yes gene_type:complete